MSIILECNLCEKTVEDVDNVMMEIQHWLIVKSFMREEHFCRQCRPKQEVVMAAEKEKQ